jgi:hypothetical protein
VNAALHLGRLTSLDVVDLLCLIGLVVVTVAPRRRP